MDTIKQIIRKEKLEKSISKLLFKAGMKGLTYCEMVKILDNCKHALQDSTTIKI